VSPISNEVFTELTQIRAAIELYCLEEKIDSYSDKDISDLTASMARAGKYLEGGRDRLAQDSHLDFHYLIVEKCGNKLMIGLYETNRTKLKRYLRVNIKRTADRIKVRHQSHKQILEAIRRKDKAEALRLLRSTLRKT